MVAFAHSVIGASHIKNGQPCQDASLVRTISGEKANEAYTFIAVADGHGDKPYFRSDIGSRFAVEAANECVTDSDVINALKITKRDASIAREKERDKIITQLKRSIVGRWNILVAEHAENNPFTKEELADVPEKYANEYRAGKSTETAYGTTLIAALLTDSFMLAMQIGDGNIVTVGAEGIFAQPVSLDEKCVLNITTSLCDKDAIGVFQHGFVDTPLAAVLIGTDGIDDCFAGAEKLFNFYRVVLTSFRDKDEETAKTELIDYLPRLSEKGSGDDISIGVMIDMELLKTINIETPNQEAEGGEADGGECDIGEVQRT